MKLVVIGGVAAGMSAAARARRLSEDAEIVVFERGQYVSFANCGLPYHIGGTIKDRDRLLLQTPKSLRAMLNIDVRTGNEVVSINPDGKTVTVKKLESGETYEELYDKLVLSPGASPIRPPLPGIEHPRIFALRNVDDMDRIKAVVDAGAGQAVVIGGGYIGIEMAEALRERGLQVDLVEMADQLVISLDKEMAHELERHMQFHGVRLHLGSAAAAFGDESGRVRTELVSGDMLSADLVILAIGVRPENQLAKDAGLDIGEKGGILVNDKLQTSNPDIYAGGDAVQVTHLLTGEPVQIPLAGPANRQGRSIADHIFGKPGVYTSTQGTAIVKVFDMTAGMTGLSEKALKQLKRDYHKVYLHPAGHAGYYPGTAPMHIKMMFDPKGKVLGAQAVGYDGIDKRLDVFATAIKAGMTVQDLQELELAYAPPYGSAKDPVNMAGFIATNLLDGDIECWYPEDYPEETGKGVVLDVRSPQEYDSWHIPGAINIPLDTLRSDMDQLDKAKPIFVYCKVGFRSYLAYRILVQNGFTVSTLTGGTMTFCTYHDTGICPTYAPPPVINYAEQASEKVVASTGNTVELDLRGLQCPGPIRELCEAMAKMSDGDEITAVASDAGFVADAPAWASKNGHEVVSVNSDGKDYTVVLRKQPGGSANAAANATCSSKMKKTMVVFSGELDKALAAFIIANGAASMGDDFTMFFTFWGLNVLRKDQPQAAGKGLLEWMFGWMMPSGPNKLALSKMNMAGIGTRLMKKVMRDKNVETLPSLMAHAKDAGVKMVACTMSMDIMGIKREELIDGIEYAGVASFLGESDEANMTMFI